MELVAFPEQILLLDNPRLDTQSRSRLEDRGLHDECSLRSTEATEGGIGWQIGAATDSGSLDIGYEIAVGAVKKRPVQNGR